MAYAMEGTIYQPLFEPQYCWSEWAAPKTDEGKPDLDRMRIGQDLVDFVNNDLMAYLIVGPDGLKTIRQVRRMIAY